MSVEDGPRGSKAGFKSGQDGKHNKGKSPQTTGKSSYFLLYFFTEALLSYKMISMIISLLTDHLGRL